MSLKCVTGVKCRAVCLHLWQWSGPAAQHEPLTHPGSHFSPGNTHINMKCHPAGHSWISRISKCLIIISTYIYGQMCPSWKACWDCWICPQCPTTGWSQCCTAKDCGSSSPLLWGSLWGEDSVQFSSSADLVVLMCVVGLIKMSQDVCHWSWFPLPFRARVKVVVRVVAQDSSHETQAMSHK